MIIDPSVFYWINMVDVFNELTFVLFIITLIMFIIITIVNALVYTMDYEEKPFLIVVKIIKILGIASLIFVALTIILPNKETMIEMLVCKYTTATNIEALKSSILELITEVTTVLK